MSPNQAKDALVAWPTYSSKILKYRQELWPDEYLMVEKLGPEQFKLNEDSSTTFFDFSDFERFLRMLESESLIITEEWLTTPTKLKTGGCTMGCWIIGKDAPHDFKCALYIDSRYNRNMGKIP